MDINEVYDDEVSEYLFAARKWTLRSEQKLIDQEVVTAQEMAAIGGGNHVGQGVTP